MSLYDKPFSAWTDEELEREWYGAMYYDVTEGLSAEQLLRLSGIEAETHRRQQQSQ